MKNLSNEMNELNLSAREVLESWEAAGLTISKYDDATEDARDGLTVEEAIEVAREDASLIYVA